ncbi:hypothetical protein CkaCkLH20_13034 [Colletotrichum karsti]|uniref:Uncharacterized protein n=1 Tax=Colletotrichum karsti TaxID=1095194 RepID=A0A9P6HWD1_9PEZI|nr:uncharacterized protein CkaCkLH20_13034 [Colletotrichum karsti]KAF9869496.1 hypothetical protein CkaCkLH20_13034 [Colletotrichum karsti]
MAAKINALLQLVREDKPKGRKKQGTWKSRMEKSVGKSRRKTERDCEGQPADDVKSHSSSKSKLDSKRSMDARV